jgi:hypothetical protein
MNHVHTLYYAAERCDRDYSDVIRRTFPTRNRWTLTPAQNAHPAIRAAYVAKVAADAALSVAMRREVAV